jgi:hypothetical protein
LAVNFGREKTERLPFVTKCSLCLNNLEGSSIFVLMKFLSKQNECDPYYTSWFEEEIYTLPISPNNKLRVMGSHHSYLGL